MLLASASFFFAQPNRNRHGRSHADQIRKRKVNDYKRHSQVQSRKSVPRQYPSHQNAVDGLVQGGGQHAYGARNSRQKEQLYRRGF
mgnify:CR=1 FL=1